VWSRIYLFILASLFNSIEDFCWVFGRKIMVRDPENIEVGCGHVAVLKFCLLEFVVSKAVVVYRSINLNT
jgi:hypothetical protein